MIPLDSFVGQSADGKMVPIIPGGNSIPLTFSNRKEYVERAIEYRLHEMDRQVRWNILGGACEYLPLSPNSSWISITEFWHMNLLCWFICIYILAPIQRLFRPYLWVSYLLTQGLFWGSSEFITGWIEAKLWHRPSYPAFLLLLMSYCSPTQCPQSSLVIRVHIKKPWTTDLAIPHECLFLSPATVLQVPAKSVSPLQTSFPTGPLPVEVFFVA